MKIIAITQKGIDKPANEDRIIIGKSVLADGILKSDIASGVLAIADGVGGNNAGSVASHFVANNVCALNDITTDAMKAVNDELIALSAHQLEYTAMATTLSGVFFTEKRTRLFHVGNTRVYMLQSGKYLKQLTNDDTTVNYLLSTGQLRNEDIDTFDRKNEITACFGGGNPNLFKMKISDIDTFGAPLIFTSDGIHDYLSLDQMESLVDEFGLSGMVCKKIIAAARENGSHDDASIILGGI